MMTRRACRTLGICNPAASPLFKSKIGILLMKTYSEAYVAKKKCHLTLFFCTTFLSKRKVVQKLSNIWTTTEW
jgi:hypothetical protein